MQELVSKKNEVVKAITDIEFVSELATEDEHPSGRNIKLPIDQIASLGIAFEPLADAFMHITQGGGYVSGLAKVTIPAGTHLSYSTAKGAYIGTALSDSTNIIAAQAGITPLVCNPTMLFAAMALMSVNKKLDAIQKGQEEILELLMEEKKAKQRANLTVLTDVLNNYKYNWNSERYKDGNYVKVLDIRQTAEEHIIFHRKRIEKQLEEKKLIHVDKTVEKKTMKLRDEFYEYHLALYLYSFAQFLEIMLLENFDETYLNRKTERIREYIYRYRELYTDCYEQLDEEARKSIDRLFLRGISKVGKGAGELIDDVPLINRGLLDEALKWTGETIEEMNDKKHQRMLGSIFDTQDILVQPFIENIESINDLYNKETVLYIDGENIYLDNIEE